MAIFISPCAESRNEFRNTGKHVQRFRLIPYPASELPNIQITGKVERLENRISIQYEVRGDTNRIIIPALSESPARTDDLWKMTCFEFFLVIKNLPEYWEFNLSPSGNWNVYHMDAYRRIGFREETSITRLPFEFKKESDGFSLDVSVDLTLIIQPNQKLQAGITAVIQTKDGNESYWALFHPGANADFHLRESFIISV